MPVSAVLDHVVINVLFKMNEAAPAFEALGFTLTPRGYHSLGSINHLMMFDTDYLELIGLPPGAGDKRPDIVDSPAGINGLVFKSADVDETFAHLRDLDMAGAAPKAFTRPVALAAGEKIARFRTVAVGPGVFAAGRVYYCQHGTPELVWRPEWQNHANGAQRISEFVIVALSPEQTAERYAALVGAKVDGGAIAIGGARLTILSPADYGDRYGDRATAMDGRQSIFGAVVLETADLDAVARQVAAAGERFTAMIAPDCVAVRVPAFNALLVFRAA